MNTVMQSKAYLQHSNYNFPVINDDDPWSFFVTQPPKIWLIDDPPRCFTCIHSSVLLLRVRSLQDALASFDFLNKRNSVAVKPDLDRVVEQEIQHPDLELIAIQKDAEIR